MKKYKCRDCGYYWEIKASKQSPIACPVCKGTALYRSMVHKRYSKRSRQKIRKVYSIKGR